MESIFAEFPMSPNVHDLLASTLLPDPIEVLQSNDFPDAVKNLTSQQCRQVVETLATSNNTSLANKKGPLGGFSLLHWLVF